MMKQNSNRLINTREHLDSCQMRGGWGEWVGKVMGLRRRNWLLQNSHGDVKCSMRNIVNDIQITIYGVRQVLDILG